MLLRALVSGVKMVKSAVEWFGFAGEAIDFIGGVKRVVAGAAVAAAVGGAAVGVSEIAKLRSVEQGAASVASLDDGRVYHFTYLLDHPDLLKQIAAKCKDGAEGKIERCLEADKAQKKLQGEYAGWLLMKVGDQALLKKHGLIK